MSDNSLRDALHRRRTIGRAERPTDGVEAPVIESRSPNRVGRSRRRRHIPRRQRWMIAILSLMVITVVAFGVMQMLLPDECLPPNCIPDD